MQTFYLTTRRWEHWESWRLQNNINCCRYNIFSTVFCFNKILRLCKLLDVKQTCHHYRFLTCFNSSSCQVVFGEPIRRPILWYIGLDAQHNLDRIRRRSLNVTCPLSFLSFDQHFDKFSGSHADVTFHVHLFPIQGEGGLGIRNW